MEGIKGDFIFIPYTLLPDPQSAVCGKNSMALSYKYKVEIGGALRWLKIKFW